MENTDARVLLQHIYNTYGYQISKNFKDNAIRDAFELADKALEKQIPKKPTPIDYEKYTDVIDNAKFLRGAYWCPNCKHVVTSGTFCEDCVQKLNWSEESEENNEID